MPWLMVVFPILHVVAGVGLTSFTLASLVNTTTIGVGRGLLSIKHSPIWWPRNRVLSSDRIRQLFCKQRTHRDDDSTNTVYSLWALLSDGSTVKLLDSWKDADQVLYLEQEIERALGLRDEPVGGEMRRD